MAERPWIVDRLGPEAFECLSLHLSGSELQSVLLEVMQRRARTRRPAEVLTQYERDPFCRPAVVDQRTSLEIDRHLLDAARDFEALELAPITPFATCSAVALTDQNRVVSALRATEVVSDPTNVLALECASRLRKDPTRPVHLTTSQRVVRAQPAPKGPGFSQHFRIFVLASGGIETKDHGFSVETLVSHIRTIAAGLDRLEEHGFAFGARRVDILATEERAALGDRVATALGALAERKLLEHAYYSGGLRYMFWVTPPDGTPLLLIDGGSFDWLVKLTSNRRARFLATGMGAQLVAHRFRK